MSTLCPQPTKISFNEHLRQQGNIPHDLRHLLVDISRAAKYIQYAIRTTEAGLAGSINQFGEEQEQLDVLSDDLIRQYLCESRLVSTFLSEEHAEIIELDTSLPYSVVFDPLDGSSLVNANFAIGSIVGVYEGNTILGRTPSEQVAAMYFLYGPRTILVYTTKNGVHEFLLNDVGEFVLLRDHLGIADDAKNYSPGNLRAIEDNAAYKTLMHHWLDDALTLRYSGCMVADIHHILTKGQGIFTNVGGSKYPQGKLRHAIECGPFALLVEQAGGVATDGTTNIMEKPIEAIDQRSPLIIGSKNAVEHACSVLH